MHSNLKFMKEAGAEVVPVDSGSKTLVDAVSECMRHYVSNCDNTHLAVGSAIGANVFLKICAWSTSQISRELKRQLIKEFGKSKVAFYGTPSNGRFWTRNRTLRCYLDLKENFVYDKENKSLTRIKLNGVPY